MKYWISGFFFIALGYSAISATRLFSSDPEDFRAVMDIPFIGETLEKRFYGEHKEKADAGNLQSMLQMYFFYERLQDYHHALEYERRLRKAAGAGSAIAQINLDIFVDHNRRERDNREQIAFGLRLMRERDEHPEYRDMWSDRRSADAFATYLSFVTGGDSDAVDVWDNEPDLWDRWNWADSDWLNGAALAREYPLLASR